MSAKAEALHRAGVVTVTRLGSASVLTLRESRFPVTFPKTECYPVAAPGAFVSGRNIRLLP